MLNATGQNYYNALAGNQVLSYTMFKSPIMITESGKGKCNFEYNSHLSRTKQLYHNVAIAPSTVRSQRKTKLYTDDGSTEIILDTQTNTVKIITFVGGDAYGAVMYTEKLLTKATGVIASNKLYLHRDYQGTIIAVSNSLGVAVEKRGFDAWGNLVKLVNSANASILLTNGLLAIDRGYTGHEHLNEVRLIHMNGRLYDPLLRSFLMPDNFVQQPENTQNYNRYAYVLNNPLKYTDPDGEFFWSAVTAIFETVANVFTHGVNVNNYDYQKTNMAWNIDKGLLQGNFGQILNRFTWGIGQTFFGNLISHGYNWAGNVEGVTYLDGATAIETNRDKGAFSMGGYINGPKGFKADWKDHLFVHEYGHYIQGQWFGPLYIPVVATTSILSAAGLGGEDHESRWFEVQASRMGGKHFDEKYGSGAAGYVQNSKDYFDYTSYKKGGITPYDNPRYLLYPAKYTNGTLVPVNQQKGHPTSGARFSVWDVFVPLLSLSFIPFL